MNCHSQIWTNANLLLPVRTSWATGDSITWTKVHDLPDLRVLQSFHSREQRHGLLHLSWPRGPDAADVPAEHAADGVVPELPSQCPEEHPPPCSEIYNMAWQSPTSEKPVWCGTSGLKAGVPTRRRVNCVTTIRLRSGAQIASLQMPATTQRAQAVQTHPRCRLP